MYDIQKVQMINETSVYEMPFQNGAYRYQDFLLTAKDGILTLTGKETPVSKIRITFSHPLYSDHARILGDALERGYGTLGWKELNPSVVMPWYFLVSDGDKTSCFGVKTQPNAFCLWCCSRSEAELLLDIQNGSRPLVLNGRTLTMCQVVICEYTGDSFDALSSFCSKLCDHPRIPDRIIYGGNDWYCNYGKNSQEKILTHTRRIVECSPRDYPEKPFMVIDDGWQPFHRLRTETKAEYNGGPWRSCNAHFGDMKETARRISEEGAIPGIWFRPLLTCEKVPSDCILKENGGEIILDPSSPSALAIIQEDVRALKGWGYRLIKHDFSTFDIFGKWGFEMNGIEQENLIFSDSTKTTAEIIKNFYLAIREAAGDDVLVMGCNTISHLSAEIFDLQRTGDDTSGVDWERVTKYGVNTLAFRIAQHQTFYSADADCVGITGQIPWEKNRQWLDVLAKSGTPLFVSIGEHAYSSEVKEDIKRAFELVTRVTTPSRPLDWKETRTPARWKSEYGEDTYLW